MPQKLLLADDSVTIQRVIELTFADEDVQVIAVGDGRQAIDRIAAERPDIVLADIGMPGCDGYEVSSFVKSTPDLADIPVLLLTGAFEPLDESRAAASRCDGILAKPFEPQQLIAKVKDLLGRRGYPAPAAPPAAVDTAVPVTLGPGPGAADELGAAPPSASSRNTPVEDLELIAPIPPRDRSSLDDYFDRLDAAFANLATAPAATASDSPANGVEDDLGGDEALWGTRPVEDRGPIEAGGPVAEPVRAVAAPDDSAPPPAMATPELFSALLEAEQRGEAPAGDGLPSWPPAAPSIDELAEQVTSQVVERLADRSVRELAERTVRDVAERLVREEIQRLKERVAASHSGRA